MSAGELLLVIAGVLCSIGFAALVVVLVRVLDALRDVRRELDDLRAETTPLIQELQDTTDEARATVNEARAAVSSGEESGIAFLPGAFGFVLML